MPMPMATVVVQTGKRTWQVASYQGACSIYMAEPTLYRLSPTKYRSKDAAVTAAHRADDQNGQRILDYLLDKPAAPCDTK